MRKTFTLFVGFTLSGAPDVWTRDPVPDQYKPFIKYITGIAKSELKTVRPANREELVEIRRKREEDPGADDYEKSAGSIIIHAGSKQNVCGGFDGRLEPAFSRTTYAATVSLGAYELGMKEGRRAP